MWSAAVAAVLVLEPLVPVLLTRCWLPWCPVPVPQQGVGVVEAPLTLLLLLLPPVLLVLPLALVFLLHHQGEVEGVHLQARAVLAVAAAAVSLLVGRSALRHSHTAASKPGWGHMPAGSNRYSHSLGGSIPLGAGTPRMVVPWC